MEKSKYNLIINNKIINTKTGSEIMLTDEYLKAFEICDLTFFNSKELEILLQNGFLVNSRIDEKLEVLTALKNKEQD